MPTSSSSVAFHILGYRIDISGRLFEWHAALGCIGVSIIMMLPGDVRIGKAFSTLYNISIQDESVGSLFFMIGLVRVLALAANGHIGVVGPRVRAVGAAVGALGWVQLAVASLLEGIAFGFVSISIALFFNLALFDLIAAYRAGLDVREQW